MSELLPTHKSMAKVIMSAAKALAESGGRLFSGTPSSTIVPIDPAEGVSRAMVAVPTSLMAGYFSESTGAGTLESLRAALARPRPSLANMVHVRTTSQINEDGMLTEGDIVLLTNELLAMNAGRKMNIAELHALLADIEKIELLAAGDRPYFHTVAHTTEFSLSLEQIAQFSELDEVSAFRTTTKEKDRMVFRLSQAARRLFLAANL
ncbi:hypothetical protein CALCODRAFT_552442 [Calocera cornea HHB12733]|uniref:Uncharacterized protein n=1 Tax=Calocera cornea HHB12733 TaxID=1353952 RepID=A0A165K2U4_9BASI|nr:hypothetical protein CALCODRAFT_552442 [Calocera cornea HHB12733]